MINIQGDEPLIDPHIIDDCVHALQASPDAVYRHTLLSMCPAGMCDAKLAPAASLTGSGACSTACTPLDLQDVALPHRVKVILDKDGYAIYFSRGLLPCNKSGKPRAFPPPFADKPYLLHLGIACFDRAFLAEYCRLPATPHMVRHHPFGNPLSYICRASRLSQRWCS